MPGIVQGRLNFNMGSHGWSENLFKKYTTSLALPDALNSLVGLIAGRAGLLSKNAQIASCVVSDIGFSRDSLIQPVLPPAGGPTGTQDSDPDDALLVRKSTSDGRRWANWYVRGLPNGLVGPGGIYAPTKAYTDNLNDYGRLMHDAGWGWLGREQVDTVTTVDIQAIAIADPGVITVTLKGPLFKPVYFNKDSRLSIQGVEGAFQLNGPVTVKVIDATSFKLLRRTATFDWIPGTGKVTWHDKDVFLPDFVRALRLTERKAGLPPYLSRGRSRARRVR